MTPKGVLQVPILTCHRRNMIFRKSEGLLRLFENSFFKCFVTSMLVTVCMIVYKIEVNLIYAFETLSFFWEVASTKTWNPSRWILSRVQTGLQRAFRPAQMKTRKSSLQEKIIQLHITRNCQVTLSIPFDFLFFLYEPKNPESGSEPKFILFWTTFFKWPSMLSQALFS